jgi:hypothetical protein
MDDEMLSRRDIIKELTELRKEFGLNSMCRVRKSDLMRVLLCMRRFKEMLATEPQLPIVKPGPLGPRIIPVQKMDLFGDTIASPGVPIKRTTYDRSKPKRCVVDLVQNGGLVTFKD